MSVWLKGGADLEWGWCEHPADGLLCSVGWGAREGSSEPPPAPWTPGTGRVVGFVHDFHVTVWVILVGCLLLRRSGRERQAQLARLDQCRVAGQAVCVGVAQWSLFAWFFSPLSRPQLNVYMNTHISTKTHRVYQARITHSIFSPFIFSKTCI